MSLNWNWNDKMGTCTFIDNSKCNLYRGNAFTIAIHEDDETKTYNLVWFASDEQHFKNMLGYPSYKDNLFAKYGIVAFDLDTKYKETTKIVTNLARAKMKVQINLY